MRDTPMKWPMRDARQGETRLRDGFRERRAYEMASVRSTSTRDTSMRDTPMRDKSVRCMPYGRCMPVKCLSIGDIFNQSV